MSSEVYLVSSSDPDGADGLFHGYCFCGSDFVFGDGGARAFREATGRRIGSGEDGCYVSVEADGDDFAFRSDFYGYKKIFYLHQDGFWAVSNSLYRLVEHLRRLGRPIVPNYGQLASLSGRGTRHVQLTSLATPVQDVALLPVGTVLRIGPRGARIEPTAAEAKPATYEDALTRFVGAWVSRFMTIISQEEAVLMPELSGGIDSRAVFGLIHVATERLGRRAASRPRYRSGTSKRQRNDLRVARFLAERFGLSLNEPDTGRNHAAADGFGLWRDLNLGSYHRIRFPTRGLRPLDIKAGGGGGENHRPFYGRNPKHGSFESFVSACAGPVRPDFLAHQFRREMTTSMLEIERRSRDEVDPLVLHYRHFRNRFHAGRAPQHTVKILPLGSRLLESCAALAGDDRIGSGQLLYDILASTVPALLDIPFDAENKAPDSRISAALTRVIPDEEMGPGRFFAATFDRDDRSAGRRERPVDQLHREFDAAVAMPFVSDFCDPALIAEAEKVLSRARGVGDIENPAETQPISAVLSAAMVRP